MPRFWILFPALASLCVSQMAAQSSEKPQDYAFQISPAQPWIDTGLNLQSGDLIKISATAVTAGPAAPGVPACDPAGIGATQPALPLPSASPGALIARLHGEASAPVLVGASAELHITEPARLTLGMNVSGTPACQGGFAIRLQKSSPEPSSDSAEGGQQKSRGQQLKSQALNAAQIFMSGQFGAEKAGSATSGADSSDLSSGSASPIVTASRDPLDSDLTRNLATLPRRVNDQFKNLGDMVNFVIVGNQKDVQAALEAANWHVADITNSNAILNAVEQTYGSKDYLAMPMSVLFLFGRKQDFGYEMAEPIAMVASRHHFRIWKAPFTWNGKEVWVGAGTHDIGFAKDKRNNSVTHKIDPAVDGERDNIGSSLQKSGKIKSLTYYLPPNPVQDAKNATGDGYHSDGRLLVILLP